MKCDICGMEAEFAGGMWVVTVDSAGDIVLGCDNGITRRAWNLCLKHWSQMQDVEAKKEEAKKVEEKKAECACAWGKMCAEGETCAYAKVHEKKPGCEAHDGSRSRAGVKWECGRPKGEEAAKFFKELESGGQKVESETYMYTYLNAEKYSEAVYSSMTDLVIGLKGVGVKWNRLRISVQTEDGFMELERIE